MVKCRFLLIFVAAELFLIGYHFPKRPSPGSDKMFDKKTKQI